MIFLDVPFDLILLFFFKKMTPLFSYYFGFFYQVYIYKEVDKEVWWW